MATEIISPLMPLTQSVDQAQTTIPLFQTLGVLLSMYARHKQYDTQTIGQWLGRVMPFLNHHQARLFITEGKTPYGFASWVEVPEAVHQQLLKDATWVCVEPQLAQLLSRRLENNQPYYLWFIDLLTPFGHALAATKDLKQRLSNHQSAWALNINQGQRGPRRVW